MPVSAIFKCDVPRLKCQHGGSIDWTKRLWWRGHGNVKLCQTVRYYHM